MRLFTRLYYDVKPFLPARIRLGLRRWVAAGTRRRHSAEWPITETAGVPPAGWAGWPDGRRFALVLTHDVEGARGLSRCQSLARLEADLGFRSSFNFVPEGEYETPPSLRKSLTAEGFEVGVHDLNHDGKLYRSRAGFASRAQRINHYLRSWNAVGFRSGFMLHELDWLHDLDVLYDASTFDVDPFEPQPDGVGTIFPFWIRGREARPGYVEMPYTLPQDSTLFLFLGEQGIDVWKRKLDWVARCGGMALINVHPDYMAFDGKTATFLEYPVAWYRELLGDVADEYHGEYWMARPQQVAELIRSHAGAGKGGSESGVLIESESTVSATNRGRSTLVTSGPGAPVLARGSGGNVSSGVDSITAPDFDLGRTVTESLRADVLRGKRAAVITFSPYPYDPRPRRATEALVAEGMQADVICIRQNGEPARESANEVRILRIPIRHRRGGKLTYLIQYTSFIAVCFFILAMRALGRRYDVVHVHNMPDVLVFSALIPKLLGARVVLDLHDPMPELLMTIFALKEKSRGVQLLKVLERWSIAFADQVFTVNLACRKIFGARSCAPEKVQVVMNSPDERIFAFRERASRSGAIRDPAAPFVIMFHGSIVERHGLDLAVLALEKLSGVIPHPELRIYGQRTRFLDQVLEMVEEKKLQDRVRYLGPMKLEKIVAAIDECDVGVIPNRRNIFTELNTPTRIFEYLSRAVPVIAPRAPGIQDYFGEEDLVFFGLGDVEDLSRQIHFVYSNPGPVDEIVRRGQLVYQAHRWQEERQRLVRTFGRLVASGRR